VNWLRKYRRKRQSEGDRTIAVTVARYGEASHTDIEQKVRVALYGQRAPTDGHRHGERGPDQDGLK
jgi:hypothetical protein